eukprot:m.40761 g.40761  ORF g.40761 m.40761 type:complete len:547 (+) comp6945_c0_seq1:43-1683(+)
MGSGEDRGDDDGIVVKVEIRHEGLAKKLYQPLVVEINQQISKYLTSHPPTSESDDGEEGGIDKVDPLALSEKSVVMNFFWTHFEDVEGMNLVDTDPNKTDDYVPPAYTRIDISSGDTNAHTTEHVQNNSNTTRIHDESNNRRRDESGKRSSSGDDVVRVRSSDHDRASNGNDRHRDEDDEGYQKLKVGKYTGSLISKNQSNSSSHQTARSLRLDKPSWNSAEIVIGDGEEDANDSDNALIEPGKFSLELLKALGCKEGETPYLFKRMERMGYPMGWIGDEAHERLMQLRGYDISRSRRHEDAETDKRVVEYVGITFKTQAKVLPRRAEDEKNENQSKIEDAGEGDDRTAVTGNNVGDNTTIENREGACDAGDQDKNKLEENSPIVEMDSEPEDYDLPEEEGVANDSDEIEVTPEVMKDKITAGNVEDVRRVLIASGTNAHQAANNVLTDHGITPLHLACALGKIDISSLLIEYGAKVNAQTDAGDTPLHNAVYVDNVPLVRLLLESNARTDILSMDGISVADLAQTKSQAMRTALIQHQTRLAHSK